MENGSTSGGAPRGAWTGTHPAVVAAGHPNGAAGATAVKPSSRLPGWLRPWAERFERSVAGHATALLRDVVIIDKAMLMAAVSFVSFVPMLIVLAAVVPVSQIHNFTGTLQQAMALDDNAARALRTLFAPAG